MLNIKLISDFPFWFLILCILGGAAYSFLLYFKERKNEFSLKLKMSLAIIRLIVVSVIAFLLLAPMIRKTTNLIVPPTIVIAQDNSESITLTEDSSYYKEQYKTDLIEVEKKIGEKYELNSISYDSEIHDSLTFAYNGKTSDIDKVLGYISSLYANRNLGAVVIASDGIYNRGTNPLYGIQEINAPIYTVALGDTTVRKDVLIKDLKYNKVSYLGNYFPLEIIVEGKKLKGEKVRLKVMNNNNELFVQDISLRSNSYIKSIPVRIEATEAGLQKYSIVLSQLDGEVSKANNYRNIYIDILDSRQKVLILNAVPHPDITALKKSIESNRNYEVETFPVAKFNKSIEGYNLVILHGLPSYKNKINSLLTQAENLKTPLLFILSSETSIATLNSLRKGLNIKQKSFSSNDAKALYNNEFSLFTVDPKTIEKLYKFPPLNAPFGEYSKYVSTNVLFKQQIGSISSSMPMVVFGNDKENKVGYIVAEGLWRWKLADYKYNKNHNSFNEIISKIVQYLCIKIDKSLFRVRCKNSFNENENIEFTAELYNDSYELVNVPEVELIVSSEDKRYPYTFKRTTNSYRLNIGNYPPGEYNYISKTIFGGKEFIEKGVFTVKKVNLESLNLVADHHLLYNISEKTGGEMIYPHELPKIIDLLDERDDIVSIRYPQKTFSEIIQIPYLLAAIIFLLSIEWFIRKWKGGY